MTGRSLYAWFMDHPVGTILLTIALVLLGILAFPRLSIAPLPEADFPTIQITASLPGASAETMASSVATPLEVQLSTISGITEMTSSSSLGQLTLNLQFSLEKDIDSAAQEVQAAINTAAARLPEDMPSLPTWRKVNPADSPILILSANSDSLSMTELSDQAETVLARQLSQVQGVGLIEVVGQQRPAIRIQARPEVLAGAGVTLADIREAVQRSSVNLPKGALFGDNRISTLAVNDQLFEAHEYADIIVTYRHGSAVRIKDLATVQLGAENDYTQYWPNGRPGVALVIRRQPGANIVATAERIQAALPGLRAALPAAMEVEVLNDRTRTIRSSLHEVMLTLVIAIVLVVGVMALFLRQWSATLIVSTVLGVSLIATCAVMYLAGFSLNNLTLVAIVIAVGFIVDDAIVVVENIHRHLEAGESRYGAALKGVREIGFTVVSISVSLVAAFIPLLFMGGVIGRLFREFALTATAAILISVVVCLTLVPTLAALFMQAPKHREGSTPGFTSRLVRGYDRALRWALDHQRSMLGIFMLSVVLSVTSFVMIPKGFFPLQDTAFIIGFTQAAPDIAYDEMVAKHKQLEAIFSQDPAVISYNHGVGGASSDSIGNGRIWLVLNDPGQRDENVSQVIDRLRPQLAQVPGIQVFLRAAQDINIGAGVPRAQYQYVLRAQSSAELAQWTRTLTERLRQMPAFQDVSHDLQLDANITRLTIDRDEAARYGFSAADVDNALYDAFGQRQINEYQTETNQYQVVLELSTAQRGNAESLAFFHLRSPTTGEMVPLRAFARLEAQESGPQVIAHNGMLPAANISFNLSAGVALGDAVAQLEALQLEVGMPASVTGTFQGAAQAFQASLASQPLLILTAMLAVYIILGVLYESFVHPLTILSTLPSAGIGAILLLWAWQLDFSIMALIGLILLIGIVKKNGILLIDFALHAQRVEGLSPREAIHQACLTRFRPILMTTLAALLGAVPLMLAFGTGAELREPLGVAIVGGLMLSQVLTMLTTPVVYLALDRLSRRHNQAGAAQPSGGAL
ncbi:multidrug efflux RND transporter permease subunit [Pseudomonas fulva]|uniref:multidrug efflux RND transporter permease subunit n=1 Tax=Pseudomonas fulva TaxID=47880 RepID=UPI00201E44A5|nr:multidrug efflux RND transporter permease subunit [Pseudomonas fulva]UQY33493.1 multidrug efflux RND transporter permease subunit [Pseudomonas fulva]